MNKSLLLNSLCTSCILFSAIKTNAAFPIEPFIETAEEINRTLEEDFFFGPFWRSMQTEPALEAKSLNETLKKMELETLQMQQDVRRLRNMLYGRNVRKDDVIQATKETQKKLIKTRDIFSDLLKTMDTGLADVIEKNKYQVKEYETEEYESGDATIYGIKITLPGFKQEDIKVTISTEEKNNKTIHRLEINGTKTITANTNKEKEVDGKKVAIKKTSAHAFNSSSFIMGRQKLIDYKDGTLKIKFDLPRDIDVQESGYTMTFDAEKETLTIEFPKRVQPVPQKTPLKYTNSK